VIARAVIADRARGRAAVQLFSTMNFTSVLAPIAAPVLGGVIVTGLGWRAVFAALAVMNLCTLLGVVLFVNESLPEQRRRPSGLKALASSVRSVLTNRHYLGYTTSSAFITAAMFAYVSASPFVLQDIVGLSPAAYSYTFAACSLAVAAGSAVARCTVKSVAPRRVLVGGVIALMTITASAPRANDRTDGVLHGRHRIRVRPCQHARNHRGPPSCRHRFGDLGIPPIHGRCNRLTAGGRGRPQQRRTDGRSDVLYHRCGSGNVVDPHSGAWGCS
jgi:hypothetical protein